MNLLLKKQSEYSKINHIHSYERDINSSRVPKNFMFNFNRSNSNLNEKNEWRGIRYIDKNFRARSIQNWKLFSWNVDYILTRKFRSENEADPPSGHVDCWVLIKVKTAAAGAEEHQFKILKWSNRLQMTSWNGKAIWGLLILNKTRVKTREKKIIHTETVKF